MSINKYIVIIVLLASLILASCGGQATEAPTLDVNAIMTAAVDTFVASMNQTLTAQALLVTDTASPTHTSSPVNLATTTPPPTWTQSVLNPILPTVFKSPTATGTQYTPTIDPALLASGCNNLLFILDVNFPPGTVVKPGQDFTKTWKVANVGTCDWVYLYHLVFIGGDRFNGEPPRLGKVIVPGQWTQLSVEFTAPSKPGTYTGSWRMANQPGTPFGSTLVVSIVVANPTNTPQPTSTSAPTLTPTLAPTQTPTPTDTPVTVTSYP